LPYYGPYNTGDYYKTEYANIPDGGIIPDNMIPEVPLGTVAASASMIIAGVFYIRKRGFKEKIVPT